MLHQTQIFRSLWLGARLACLLLAASGTVNAQPSNLLTVGVGSGLYIGPQDIVGSAPSAWYGMRAVSTTYAQSGTGKSVNIRRASDNETCDVIVNSVGLGNTSNCSGSDNGKTVATFLAATTGYWTELYDQSGNGYNATQSTAANQPQHLLSCIGSLPCGYFTGNQRLVSSTVTTVSSPFTVSSVAERTAATATQNVIFATGDNLASGAGVYFNNAVNQLAVYVNFTPYGVCAASANDSALHSVQSLVNGTSSSFYIDGTYSAGCSTVSAGAAVTPTIGIGNWPTLSSNQPLNGYLVELGIWPIGFTGTTNGNSLQNGKVCHNQYVYWGTAASC